FLHPPPPAAIDTFPYTTLFRSPSRGELRHVPFCNRVRAAARRALVPAAARDPDQQNPPELRVENVADPRGARGAGRICRRRLPRSEEHTSELQSRGHLVCRLLL